MGPQPPPATLALRDTLAPQPVLPLAPLVTPATPAILHGRPVPLVPQGHTRQMQDQPHVPTAMLDLRARAQLPQRRALNA